MIRTKEFDTNGKIDEVINVWLMENPRIRLIDIKYSLCCDSDATCIVSAALVIYEE